MGISLRLVLTILIFASVAKPGCALAFDRVYWGSGGVLSERLSDAETKELDRQRVETLYWRVGDLVWRGGSWRWNDLPTRPPVIQQKVVPFVHITCPEGESGPAFADLEALVTKVRPVYGKGPTSPAEAIGIEYECPSSALPLYAALLARLRTEVPCVVASVAPEWIANPAFAAVQKSVSELAVLFFAMKSNPMLLKPGTYPEPLLDLAKFKEATEAWKSCEIPWHAVIPTFATLTIYTEQGAWHDAIHDWQWNDFLLSGAFVPVAPIANGRAEFRASRTVHLISHGVHRNELISVLLPARDEIGLALKQAETAGAAGAIFFMPSTTREETGWSLPQLADLKETMPKLEVWVEGSHLVLENASRCDLPPRCQNASDRGYALELSGQAPVWSEVREGEFATVEGIGDVSFNAARKARELVASKGNYWKSAQTDITFAVPMATANRLRLTFSTLRAGQRLHTGQVLFVPNVSWSAVRYRISPIEQEWRALKVR